MPRLPFPQRRVILLPLAAVVIGGLIGNSASRLRIDLLAQSLVAMILAWLVGLFLVGAVLRFRSPVVGEPREFPAGARTVLLTVLAAGLVGAILHLAVPWKSPDAADGWIASRGTIIGIAGFIAGSIQAAIVCGLDGLRGE